MLCLCLVKSALTSLTFNILKTLPGMHSLQRWSCVCFLATISPGQAPALFRAMLMFLVQLLWTTTSQKPFQVSVDVSVEVSITVSVEVSMEVNTIHHRVPCNGLFNCTIPYANPFVATHPNPATCIAANVIVCNTVAITDSAPLTCNAVAAAKPKQASLVSLLGIAQH
jgi:hypothetical protein